LVYFNGHLFICKPDCSGIYGSISL